MFHLTLTNSGRLLTPLLLLGALQSACTRHIDCSETLTCEPAELPDSGVGVADGSDGATGSDASVDAAPDAAADAGPLQCPGGMADCDHVRFNGCEIDVSSDLRNCGACGVPCDGVCSAQKCTAVQAIATGQYNMPDWGGVALTSSAVYWVSSAAADSAAAAYRIQKAPLQGGPVTSLRAALPSADRVVACDQLFYAGRTSPAVFTLGFDGSGYQQAVAKAVAFACNGNSLYFTDNTGGAALKAWDSGATATLWTGSGASETAWPSMARSADNRFAFGLHQTGAIELIGGGAATPLGSYDTAPGRIRFNAQGKTIYWLDGAGFNTAVVSASSVATSVVRVPGARDFAVTAAGDAYLAARDPDTREEAIWVRRAGSPRFDPFLSRCARSLETDGSYLYFFECDRDRLARFPLK